MPITSTTLDCSPLLTDNEIEILDEQLLAVYIGNIILGDYFHIQQILNSRPTAPPTWPDRIIEHAIGKLNSLARDKRDGWIFQIISWLTLFQENLGNDYHCQQPHDAAAQHGIDGLAIIFDDQLRIKTIVISEDKCSENPRVVIPEVWEEFAKYESGENDNKLVSRISAMISHLDSGRIFTANRNDIYRTEIRRYRLSINRNSTYNGMMKRKKLFKGYDEPIPDADCERRTGATLFSDDIRGWMDHMAQLVINYLDSQKTGNV